LGCLPSVPSKLAKEVKLCAHAAIAVTAKNAQPIKIVFDQHRFLMPGSSPFCPWRKLMIRLCYFEPDKILKLAIRFKSTLRVDALKALRHYLKSHVAGKFAAGRRHFDRARGRPGWHDRLDRSLGDHCELRCRRPIEADALGACQTIA
jgi:hypothetical protein